MKIKLLLAISLLLVSGAECKLTVNKKLEHKIRRAIDEEDSSAFTTEEELQDSINHQLSPKSDTPLMLAIARGKVELAKKLIDNPNVNIEVINDFGNTALNLAASYGMADIVRLLLNKGAAINQRNKFGYTPINSAVVHGYTEIVELLVENSANTNIPDRYHNTPMANAAYYGHHDIAFYLLNNKAPIHYRMIYLLGNQIKNPPKTPTKAEMEKLKKDLEKFYKALSEHKKIDVGKLYQLMSKLDYPPKTPTKAEMAEKKLLLTKITQKYFTNSKRKWSQEEASPAVGPKKFRDFELMIDPRTTRHNIFVYQAFNSQQGRTTVHDFLVTQNKKGKDTVWGDRLSNKTTGMVSLVSGTYYPKSDSEKPIPHYSTIYAKDPNILALKTILPQMQLVMTGSTDRSMDELLIYRMVELQKKYFAEVEKHLTKKSNSASKIKNPTVRQHDLEQDKEKTTLTPQQVVDLNIKVMQPTKLNVPGVSRRLKSKR